MANVLLTTYCNRRCSYCFAKEKVDLTHQGEDGSASGNLSLEELATIVDFLRRSNQRDIGIIGGEPTLHPQFIQAMQLIETAGFDGVKLFTNGLMRESCLDYLTGMKPQKLHVLVNVNHPEEQTRQEFEKQGRTLKRLGHCAAVSFNIHHLDCDLSFLPRVIVDHDLDRHIRLGIAEPIVGVNNVYVPLQDYRPIARKIVELSKACAAVDIAVGLDCGFRLCMFTQDELGELFVNNANLCFKCAPILDIGAGLRVWSCFPLSGILNVSLRDFNSLQEIENFYDAKIGPFRGLGTPKECLDCKYRRRAQCGGGCVAHALRSLDVPPVWLGNAPATPNLR